MDFKRLTDDEFFKQCEHSGRMAMHWRYDFMGRLPEALRRNLHVKKGFGSIHEFAARLGGLTHEQVTQAIRVGKKAEAFPALNELFMAGEVSVNKLERALSFATAENQEALACQVKRLSKNAIETLARDHKNENGFPEPKTGLPGQVFGLDADVLSELTELHQKGIDINAELREFLRRRKEEIAAEKEALASENKSAYEQTVVALEKGEPAPELKPYSRYINAKTRKLLQKEHGQKCAIPGCAKESEVVHHTARYALTKSHDPRYLAPLCRGHHELAHRVDVKVQRGRGGS